MSKKYTAPVSFALFQIRMVEDYVLNSEVRFHLRAINGLASSGLKPDFVISSATSSAVAVAVATEDQLLQATNSFIAYLLHLIFDYFTS